MVIPITLQITELEATLSDMQAHQESVMLARNYYNGIQAIYLNDRAREYLGLHKGNTFKFNVCRTIVRALADEINLLGIGTDETQGEDEDENRPVAEWAESVWEANKGDKLQKKNHKAALADSESFVIVEWDPELDRPKLVHNPYFVDVDAGGDGMGCYMIYENDDPEQEPIAAVKRWTEKVSPDYSRLRMTLYYSDHVERYFMGESGMWERFVEETGENEDGEKTFLDWIIPNVDSDGSPLGIPVFHFANEDLTPEHWDAITMQDAINKTLVDVLAAGDLTAFRSYFGFGFFPTVDGKAPLADGSNLMKMGPGQFNGTMKTRDQADLLVVDGADTTFLMDQFKDLILSTAQMTDTPASRFIVTAAIASDKTIKEQERGLRKKAATRRKLFGDPWVGVFDMARKLQNLYGRDKVSEIPSFVPLWESTETLEDLRDKKETLGLPIEQIWREAGYTDKQIEQMKKDPSFRVEFERLLWEGYAAASLNGIPLRLYLERIGIPKEEIDYIEKSIETQSGRPTEVL